MKTPIISLSLLFLVTCPAFAQLATPTTVTSVTLSGNTVTVNSTAHGLVANQGFCAAGSSVAADIICSTVATATANAFTYTQAGAGACSSSCGTVAPAKRFIWGAIDAQSTLGIFRVTVCVWITTPAPAPQAGTSSSCTATGPENAAIAAGTTIEKVFAILLPGDYTLADANAFMNRFQTTMQAKFVATAQPGAILGKACDSAGCN